MTADAHEAELHRRARAFAQSWEAVSPDLGPRAYAMWMDEWRHQRRMEYLDRAAVAPPRWLAAMWRRLAGRPPLPTPSEDLAARLDAVDAALGQSFRIVTEHLELVAADLNRAAVRALTEETS